MSAPRLLIVNADDFGQSAGVNEGVIRAHTHGIVTSASLMVRWPAARDAAALAFAHPKLAVGLHVDLGEWFLCNGEWGARYEVVALEDAPAVAGEIERQIDAFHTLMGRAPTHLDSHQHVHLKPRVLETMERAASALGVPLRRRHAAIAYCGTFYGQTENGSSCPEDVGVEALLRIIRALPAGITELCCHPAAAADLDTMYAAEREHELRTLCDPRVRQAIQRLEIELCSFADITSRFHAENA